MIYTTKDFWEQTLERAIKTFAQTVIAAVGVTAVAIDQVPWRVVLLTAATATVLSVLTSIASSGIGDRNSPSVAPVHNQEEDPSETVTDVSVPIPAETTSAAVLPTGGVVNNIAAATDPKNIYQVENPNIVLGGGGE